MERRRKTKVTGKNKILNIFLKIWNECKNECKIWNDLKPKYYNKMALMLIIEHVDLDTFNIVLTLC